MIDTAPFKAKLEAEKERLEAELSKVGSQTPAGDWQGSSRDSEPAIDPNEAADQIEELATNVPVVENLETRYREILAALDRIEKGTYGKCSNCNDDIPLERLEANPAADTCLNCA